MKRMTTMAVCLFALLMMCGVWARGEVVYDAKGRIDLAPYELEGGVMPVYGADGGSLSVYNRLPMWSREADWHLTYRREGAEDIAVALPNQEEMIHYSAHVSGDGRYIVSADMAYGRRTCYWFSAQGLTPFLQTEGLYSPRIMKTGYLGVKKGEDGAQHLKCWDFDGTLRFSAALDMDSAILYDEIEEADGTFVLLMASREAWEIVRVSRGGEMLSRWKVGGGTEYGNGNTRYIARDELGGYLFFAPRMEDYTQMTVMRLDEQGAMTWKKTLSADSAIAGIDMSQARADGTTAFYGRVCANSRGLFRVFEIVVDAQGNIISRDMRDFTTRCTYQYRVTERGDGQVFVVCDTLVADGDEDIRVYAVPFDALRPCEDPGLELR